jgi:nucleotide-binding universal stress UspA family protein
MNTTPNQQRIVVALDPSPQGLAALRAAVQLAAELRAELHGLFVEDDNLYRLCSLPFSQEISRYSARPRPLDRQAVERQLRATAGALRQKLVRTAEAAQVTWSFRTVRGCVADELLAAAENALLLSLGQALDDALTATQTTSPQTTMRQTPRPGLPLSGADQGRPPLTVLYTGTPSAGRALDLATRLAQREQRPLQILWHPPDETTDTAAATPSDFLAQYGVYAQVRRVERASDLLTTLRRLPAAGTLVLPVEQATLLTRLHGALIVVP